MSNLKAENNKKNYIKSFYPEIGLVFVVGLLVSINFLISYTLRSQELFFVPNFNPIGYSFGYIGSAFVLFAITVLAWYFHLIRHAPIATIMILGGIFSNFFERAILGNVADYLNVYLGYINLADIQIVTGIIILNYILWGSKSW